MKIQVTIVFDTEKVDKFKYKSVDKLKQEWTEYMQDEPGFISTDVVEIK